MANSGLRLVARDLPVSNRRPRACTGDLAVYSFLVGQGLLPSYEQRQYAVPRGVWVPDLWVPELNLNIEVTRADRFAKDLSASVRVQASQKLARKYREAAYVDRHYGTTTFVVLDADLQVLELAPERFLPELVLLQQAAA